MRRSRSAFLLAVAFAALLLVPVPASAADGDNPWERDPDELVLVPIPRTGEEYELEDAGLFFELNDTDGDLGIQATVDAEPWALMSIEDPFELTIFGVGAAGRMRQQGLTELSFESAEPGFDQLPPAEFFLRFPEGTYEIEIVSLEGDEYEAEVELSHVMAAPAGNITLSGIPAAADCDAELPVIEGDVVIDWDPVTTSHPEIGRPGEVEIVLYQLFLELEEDDEFVFGVDLPPDVTAFEVPADFLALGTEFKFEIIARTDTGNLTATESCFLTE